MLQNIYSLPDLIDLALIVPEVGAVNFNILHTVLHAIVKELRITDVRPWCRIEDPLLEKTRLMKAKLKEAALQRAISLESVEKNVSDRTESRNLDKAFKNVKDTPSSTDKKYAQKTESKSSQTFLPEKSEQSSAVQTESHKKDAQKAESKSSQTFLPEKSEQSSAVQTESRDVQKTESKSSQTSLSEKSEQSSAVQTELDLVDETKSKTAKAIQASTPKKDSSIQVEIARRERARDTTVQEYAYSEKDDKDREDPSVSLTKEEAKPKPGRIRAGEALRNRNLNMRMEAAEEGLTRLSNIVDIIVDKIKKWEQKKGGGLSFEELEAMDERLTEIEEFMAQLKSDHDLLMELKKRVDDMTEEFEAIKALGSQLHQMRIDIDLKAGKEETEAALALKGDLELVNTKVDQLEFETAIEELGEAIGLLGIKFTKKNEEWEERAAAIWEGIDSKMSRDIFEAARIKFESRTTALMYGLRKLKQVVEELLYPEASGVTRCILCRRPACISGQECLGITDSPKRPLSDKNSGDEDADNLRKTVDDAIAKKQKMDAPPYCESSETIIKLPYKSSTYHSAIDKNSYSDVRQIKLTPGPKAKDAYSKQERSQIPKLPDIQEKDSKSNRRKPKTVTVRPKSKPRQQKAELVFTKKLLEEFDRKKDPQQPKSVKYTAIIDLDPQRKKESRSSSARSSVSSVKMEQTPEEALQSFAPARLMPDAFRRNILLSPSQKEPKNISLSPLQFDSDLKKSSLNSK